MGPDIEGNVMLALGLTLFAGLATGLGSLVVFLARKPHMSLLCFGLGLSSGMMVYVSLAEFLPLASDIIGESLGEKSGAWLAVGCFFGGMLVAAVIDKLVPEPENPHEAISLEAMRLARESEGVTDPGRGADVKAASLARLGPLTALVIGLHNLPEGMATFASALADASLGLSIAVAVAIHNIPEGMAIAIPTFFATRSRRKAIFHSFASGLAEPLGALLAYLVLMSFLNDMVVAGMLAAVGGIMVFISLDELLPTAREYGKGHTVIGGVVLGMAVMAVSLLLF
jgi:ZIP family zinc transporter